MSHKKNDDDLERLLHSMPKKKDARSKGEILERLKNDNRLSRTPVTSWSKKRRVVPLLVAVAAALLIVLLLPSLMNSLNTGKQSADQMSISRDVKVAPKTDREEVENDFSNEAASEFAHKTKRASPYAVYQKDLDGGRVLNLGLQDSQAVSVPISIILTKEQMESKGLSESSTELDLYKAFAGELDESALGFEPMHPIDASFTEEDELLSIFLADPHEYDQSTATQEMFLHALIQSFQSYREILILDNSGKMAEFDQIGQLEPINVQDEISHTPYYIYRQENGKELLSPNFMQRAETFEEALQLMQRAPNDLYAPAIPKGLDYSVTVKNGVAEVRFNSRVRLDSMEMNEANQMIDALSLTASSFDVRLKVNNVEPQDWNGMNFRKTLPSAIGSNPMPFLFK